PESLWDSPLLRVNSIRTLSLEKYLRGCDSNSHQRSRKGPLCAAMKNLKPQLVFLTAIELAFFLSATTLAQTPKERKVLHGHVPKAVAELQPVGRLQATTNLSLAIGLPLRDPLGLTNFLKQLY